MQKRIEEVNDSQSLASRFGLDGTHMWFRIFQKASQFAVVSPHIHKFDGEKEDNGSLHYSCHANNSEL